MNGQRCIYCGVGSYDPRRKIHAFPEAIGQNSALLPPGSICSRCDSYFGRDLEPALTRWPGIAFILQFRGIRGKGAHVRENLAGVRIDRQGSGARVNSAARILGTRPRADGRRVLGFEIPTPPQFNVLHFRRALYLVALNSLALTEGPDFVKHTRFNEARRYVRCPHPREAWPIAVGNSATGDVPQRIAIGHSWHGDMLVSRIEILHLAFLVEPIPGALQTEAEACRMRILPAADRKPTPALFSFHPVDQQVLDDFPTDEGV